MVRRSTAQDVLSLRYAGRTGPQPGRHWPLKEKAGMTATGTMMNFNYPILLVARDDPYPTYKWMRDEDPAHYSQTEDIWVLTRYADCSAEFKDWKTWSSERR